MIPPVLAATFGILDLSDLVLLEAQAWLRVYLEQFAS